MALILMKNSNKGFTLVEIMVVISIIGIMSAITIPRYRSGQNHLALQRAASKLAQDIRRAEEMVISSADCPACGGSSARGYGVFAISGSDSYILYADTQSPDKFYSGSDAVLETIKLEKNIVISGINTPQNQISVNFEPPDPAVNLNYMPGSEVPEAIITLSVNNSPLENKKIHVNKAGLIYVE
ncbi:MAG: type II secretion system protein [Candidatus Pacebacteria bacterium]|nr:type II secretion system protein [Candidatus Paceibacterota bacterium]